MQVRKSVDWEQLAKGANCQAKVRQLINTKKQNYELKNKEKGNIQTKENKMQTKKKTEQKNKLTNQLYEISLYVINLQTIMNTEKLTEQDLMNINQQEYGQITNRNELELKNPRII